MSPEFGFFGALLMTVALLIAAAVCGRRGRIRAHVMAVLASVGMLAVAIVFALRLGKLYDLEAAGAITPVHLNLARFTTLFYLWPLLTGPLAARDRIPRRIHRVGAWSALVLTVAATVTGVWMILAAERLPSVPEGGAELGVEQER